MLTSALEYRERGWAPIPLNGKVPALASWREYQGKLPTEDELYRWWEARPQANIGLICGAVSGMVVIDLDGDIELGFEWLLSEGIPFEDCPMVKTGKGYHLYYRHPGVPVANGVGIYRKEVPGRFKIAVDIRGDGGYVVAPPSVHPDSGRRYTWERNPEELPELPSRFRGLKTPVKTDAPLGTSEIEVLLQGVSAGGRNDAAAKVAGYLLRVTRDDAAASLALLRVWNGQNTPPLPDKELTRTFDSIYAKRQADPSSRRHELPTETVALSGKAWAEAVRDAPPRQGVDTNALPTIDRMGGLVPRDLVILAGRPGMGKSTCAWNVVADCCIGQHVPTVIFSTEMTANDVARWMGGKLFKTPVGELTPAQWHRTLELLSAAPVTMVDKGSLTVDEIESVVRDRPDTRIVIVDHLQRVRTPGRESKNTELGHVAQRLKSLAKDTPCTVLALSQMNRASDLDGKPTLRALRDSGELEQEADGVIFLWSKDENPTANPLSVEFSLLKNRHGAMAEVSYRFIKHLKHFEPVSAEEILRERDVENRNKETLRQLTIGL